MGYLRLSLRLLALFTVVLAGVGSILGSGSGNDNVDLPFAIDEVFVVIEDDSVDISLEFLGFLRFGSPVNDLGTEPTIITLGDATNGTVVLDGTVVTYTPDPDYIGMDAFEYTITDSNENSDTGTITLLVGVPLLSPQRVLVDSDNNRVLVTDDLLKAVVALDLDTGVASYVSVSNDGQANPFKIPAGLALDTAGNRILVADIGLRAIVAVNPDTGTRTILSDAITPDALNTFVSPHRLAVDEGNGRVLVIDGGQDAVIAVDLTTGARTIFSSPDVPDDVNAFVTPTEIVIEAGRSRALVSDATFADVLAVDLDTGARTIVSNAGLAAPAGLTLDADNDDALIIDPGLNFLIDMRLGDGFLDVVSPPNFSSQSDLPFQFPEGVSLDAANNRALVTDVEAGRLLDVNLVDDGNNLNAPDIGERRLFPDAIPAAEVNALLSPLGIATDAAADRVLVVDSLLQAVVAVDGQTGARTILSDPETPDDVNVLSGPVSIEVDTGNNQALVVDQTLISITAVDLSTGARIILSDNTTPDETLPFTTPVDVVIDTVVGGRALVTDVSAATLFAVDLATGERSVVFDNDTDPDIDLIAPERLVVDAANNRALIIDSGRQGIVAVDLIGDNHEVLSDAEVPADQDVFFANPTGLTLDEINNRVLVSDATIRAVVAVDLTDGTRTVLSSFTEGNGATLLAPADMSEGLDGVSVTVLDNSIRGLIEVDTGNGGRSVLSR